MTQPKAKSIKLLEGMRDKLTSDAYVENRAALTAAIEALRARSNDDVASLMQEAHAAAKERGGVNLQYVSDAASGPWIAYYDRGPITGAATPQGALRALIERVKR